MHGKLLSSLFHRRVAPLLTEADVMMLCWWLLQLVVVVVVGVDQDFHFLIVVTPFTQGNIQE
jgi:hypothetical protein